MQAYYYLMSHATRLEVAMNAVSIGTKFQYAFLDAGTCKWEVQKELGKGVFECATADPAFGYFGDRKAFTKKEIAILINREKRAKKTRASYDAFYGSLQLGDIVHYFDGGVDQTYFRCEVVEEGGYKCLRQEAGKLFKPSAASIYENWSPKQKRRFKAPTGV